MAKGRSFHSNDFRPLAWATLQSSNLSAGCVPVSLAEGEELVRLVEAGPKLFALTHAYTGYPAVRQAREMVSSGELGEIRKVMVEYTQDWLMEAVETRGNKQAAWRTDPARAGLAGCVGDIGTHCANLVEFVTGRRIEALC